MNSRWFVQYAGSVFPVEEYWNELFQRNDYRVHDIIKERSSSKRRKFYGDGEDAVAYGQHTLSGNSIRLSQMLLTSYPDPISFIYVRVREGAGSLYVSFDDGSTYPLWLRERDDVMLSSIASVAIQNVRFFSPENIEFEVFVGGMQYGDDGGIIEPISEMPLHIPISGHCVNGNSAQVAFATTVKAWGWVTYWRAGDPDAVFTTEPETFVPGNATQYHSIYVGGLNIDSTYEYNVHALSPGGQTAMKEGCEFKIGADVIVPLYIFREFDFVKPLKQILLLENDKWQMMTNQEPRGEHTPGVSAAEHSMDTKTINHSLDGEGAIGLYHDYEIN